MENLYNHAAKELYQKGYVFGQNPIFIDCEDVRNVAPRYDNDAFLSGFHNGRRAYEKMNGKVTDGIPDLILTAKKLEEFTMLGEAGIPLNDDGYTRHQKSVIFRYYRRGYANHDNDQDISLYLLLSENGIDL